MAITYAPTAAQTHTYAVTIAIARAKLDELSDEDYLVTRPGVLCTDNALYLDLIQDEFYFGDFSVDGAVVFDQGQVRALMVSLADMVDRSTKPHDLRQIIDASIANAINCVRSRLHLRARIACGPWSWPTDLRALSCPRQPSAWSQPPWLSFRQLQRHSLV